MSEKGSDVYCEKILLAIILGEDKVRFNELHRKLAKHNVKMSKPTLVQHLNHLIKDEVILRTVEEKQNVSYGLNWKKLNELRTAKWLNLEIAQRAKAEDLFNSKSLAEQVAFVTEMVTIGEIFYIRLQILDLLEPENKLQNHYSYTMIRTMFNFYASLLFERCKKSEADSKFILKSLGKVIQDFTNIDIENPNSIPKRLVSVKPRRRRRRVAPTPIGCFFCKEAQTSKK